MQHCPEGSSRLVRVGLARPFVEICDGSFRIGPDGCKAWAGEKVLEGFEGSGYNLELFPGDVS